MPTKKRVSSAASNRKRVVKAAPSVPALDPLTPLAVFRSRLPAAVPATLTREALLAVQPCEVIGEHGISFDGTQWWSAELRPFVSLPPAARQRPLAAEIRWDEAARTRRQLTSITYMLRDELGRVVKTIPCGLRSIAQVTESREKDRTAKDEYEKSLKERRTQIQLRATNRFAGSAAARAHVDLVLSPPPLVEPEEATKDLAPPTRRGRAPSNTPSPSRSRGQTRKRSAGAAAAPSPAPAGSSRSAPARRKAAVPPPPISPQPNSVRRGASFAALAHTLAADTPPARRRS